MNYYVIGSLGLFLLGIVLFFVLARRRAYRDQTAAKNYEAIRQKLTLREPEPKKKVELSLPSGGVLGNLIGGFVTIVVGASLLPAIQEQVGASAAMNVTSAASTLLPMVGVFFGVGVAVAALSQIGMGLRNAGLI